MLNQYCEMTEKAAIIQELSDLIANNVQHAQDACTYLILHDPQNAECYKQISEVIKSDPNAQIYGANDIEKQKQDNDVNRKNAEITKQAELETMRKNARKMARASFQSANPNDLASMLRLFISNMERMQATNPNIARDWSTYKQALTHLLEVLRKQNNPGLPVTTKFPERGPKTPEENNNEKIVKVWMDIKRKNIALKTPHAKIDIAAALKDIASHEKDIRIAFPNVKNDDLIKAITIVDLLNHQEYFSDKDDQPNLGFEVMQGILDAYYLKYEERAKDLLGIKPAVEWLKMAGIDAKKIHETTNQKTSQ